MLHVAYVLCTSFSSLSICVDFEMLTTSWFFPHVLTCSSANCSHCVGNHFVSFSTLSRVSSVKHITHLLLLQRLWCSLLTCWLRRDCTKFHVFAVHLYKFKVNKIKCVYVQFVINQWATFTTLTSLSLLNSRETLSLSHSLSSYSHMDDTHGPVVNVLYCSPCFRS